MSVEGQRGGPDPDFPYLSEHDRFSFPDPLTKKGSLIAVGGNLSPGMLLSAYEQGIFPWFSPGDPVIWQSPDPRFVIFPEKLHVSRSMQKLLKCGVYRIAFNLDFPAVIKACSEIERRAQNGTWITSDIIEAYTKLHHLGYAHSAEAYLDGELIGGCYGILMGRAFFGESMFSLKPNASKAAFLTLARYLFENNVTFIDCQIPTKHLASLGGEEISRKDFLRLLKESVFSVLPD